jgi:NAD-dependent dihydropyrimidine dehydrogenase PreA subunit
MAVARVLNTLAYNPALCVGCGLCAAVCPHGVFAAPALKEVEVGKVKRLNAQKEVAKLVRPEACMECGACQLNCPSGAIKVDSGVGCAAAMIQSALTGKPVTCGPECCDDGAPKGKSGCC